MVSYEASITNIFLALSGGISIPVFTSISFLLNPPDLNVEGSASITAVRSYTHNSLLFLLIKSKMSSEKASKGSLLVKMPDSLSSERSCQLAKSLSPV